MPESGVTVEEAGDVFVGQVEARLCRQAERAEQKQLQWRGRPWFRRGFGRGSGGRVEIIFWRQHGTAPLTEGERRGVSPTWGSPPRRAHAPTLAWMSSVV